MPQSPYSYSILQRRGRGGWDGSRSGVGDAGESPVVKITLCKPVSCSFMNVFIHQIVAEPQFVPAVCRCSSRCGGYRCERHEVSALRELMF